MAAGQSKAIWFVVFMLIGMLIFEVCERRAQAAQLLEAHGTTG
jgi:predicted choloylglycine hydrolase